MNGIPRLNSLVHLLIMAVIMAACGPSETGPQVWIDSPGDGMTVNVGTPVSIISHAFARDGIAEVVLSVNGEAYRRDAPGTPGADYSQFNQDWLPAGAGIFAVQVVAYDVNGQASNPAVITIRVTSGCPTPIGGGPTPVTCGPVVIGCPSPVGGGPTPVSCPTEIITATPVFTDTPTSTPPPPAQTVIQFWADPAQMAAGSCTDIRWHIENAQRVIFGGIDQPFDGSYEDCLCEDEIYTLTVIRQDGTEEKHRVDIDVIGSCITPTTPPPQQIVPPLILRDITPPPVPNPVSPENGSKLNCTTSQTLMWQQVKDPSGIKTYYVKLEKLVGKQWQSAGGYTSTGRSVTINPDCGNTYRWAVRAEDGAGNTSDWSAFLTFSIYQVIQ